MNAPVGFQPLQGLPGLPGQLSLTTRAQIVDQGLLNGIPQIVVACTAASFF